MLIYYMFVAFFGSRQIKEKFEVYSVYNASSQPCFSSFWRLAKTYF